MTNVNVNEGIREMRRNETRAALERKIPKLAYMSKLKELKKIHCLLLDTFSSAFKSQGLKM